MSKTYTVIRVEMRTETQETVIKSKRHDYTAGGYKIEETIRRITTERPWALLECGHWRAQYNGGAIISKAARLGCYVCDKVEWDRLCSEKDSNISE